MLRLIPRMILFDLIKITLLTLAGISALLMTAGAMVAAAREGLDPVRVMMVMPYLIPPTFPYTIPSCLLFACTVVYGGMASSNEITAMKASGIFVMRAVWPAIFLSVALSVFSVYLSDRFIPACNQAFTDFVISDMEGNMYSFLRRRGQIVDQEFPFEIYVQNVRDRKLINPIFKQRVSPGVYDMVIKAEEATLRVASDTPGQPPNCVFVKLTNGVVTGKDYHSYVRSNELQMPIPKIAKEAADNKQQNLTYDGLWSLAEERKQRSQILDFELAMAGADSAFHGDPSHITNDLRYKTWDTQRMLRKSREAEAEVHLRIAQSAVAIPFVLLGCPLTILFPRRDFLHTFFVCFLPIVTIYYPVMVLSYNVVKEGGGSVILSLWGPFAIMCAFAVPFIRRVIRY